MTPERFQALIDAYGADPARWPAAERDAAQAMAVRNTPGAREALAGAAQLDQLLASHTIAPADSQLYRRIVASAPVAHAPWWLAHPWLSGLGFAGVGLAGIAAGVLAVSLVTSALAPGISPISPTSHEWAYTSTAFGDLGHQGEEQ